MSMVSRKSKSKGFGTTFYVSVAMGSPLGPVLANLFMSHHENGWIKNYIQGHIHFYRHYVNDIFTVFDSHDEAIVS